MEFIIDNIVILMKPSNRCVFYDVFDDCFGCAYRDHEVTHDYSGKKYHYWYCTQGVSDIESETYEEE